MSETYDYMDLVNVERDMHDLGKCDRYEKCQWCDQWRERKNRSAHPTARREGGKS